jgi:hypothetical protein
VQETWSTAVLYNDGGLVLDATMRIASLVKMYESPDQIVVPATMYLYASMSAKYCLIREDHILEAGERDGQVMRDHGRDGSREHESELQCSVVLRYLRRPDLGRRDGEVPVPRERLLEGRQSVYIKLVNGTENVRVQGGRYSECRTQ